MHDLAIRNVNLPDGRIGQDVLIAAGRIIGVGPSLDAPAACTIDGGGKLLTPPFVDAHFHMDSTLTYGMPRINESGTLLEGIGTFQEAHPDVPIYTAAIDRQLDEHAYILPGLGDAGDRIFGTK